MPKEWFILQIKSNYYQKAIRNLSNQKFETFLPLQNFSIKTNLKPKIITRPLFPGYMFVAFDKSITDWGKINNTYGVLSLVTFNSTLKSVPDSIINDLMNRNNNSIKSQPTKELKKGDQVKVLSGPFTNFIATVETYETNQRIWMLMNLLGRKTKIQTQTDIIQPLD